MTRNVVTVLLFFCITTACSSIKDKKYENKGYQIRYVNLQTIFEFTAAYDPEAMKTKIAMEKLYKKMKSSDKIKDTKTKLKRLQREENYQKTKLYKLINNAVKIVADRHGLDFILNSGDELIYGKKKYDITEEVIREIVKLKKRNAPVSR